MLDAYLAKSLFNALPPAGSRPFTLLLVGDPDQLPPVGPGQFLKDLIDSAVTPVTNLSTVFRQAASSSIVLNAHCVNAGKHPEHLWPLVLDGLSSPSKSDAPVISGITPASIKAQLFPASIASPVVPTLPLDSLAAEVDAALLMLSGRGSLVFTDSLWVDADGKDVTTLFSDIVAFVSGLGVNPRTEMQVLAPMHRGEFGTLALNKFLQSLLNPSGACFFCEGGGNALFEYSCYTEVRKGLTLLQA